MLRFPLMDTAGGDGAAAGGAAGEGAAGAGAGAAGGVGAVAWHSTLGDDARGWVQAKGLDKLPAEKAFAELVKGWAGAEKHIGAPADQIIRLPKDGDDAALANVYGKLGRPNDPNGYDIKLPDGLPPEQATALKAEFDAMKPVLHKIGLSNRQANQFAQEMIAIETAQAAEAKATAQAQLAADTKALKTEWGAAFDKNASIVDAVATQLGFDAEKVVALREVLGAAATMKMFHSIGTAMGEDKFIGGGGGKFGGAMSPAQAQAEINTLKADKDFVTRLMAGNVDAQKKWNDLHAALVAVA